MSRESSSALLRHLSRNASKQSQSEANENEFETSLNSIHFPPPRTPLDTISDPSQFQKESQDLEFNSKDKFDTHRTRQSSDRKIEALDIANLLQLSKGIGIGTPRVSGRGGVKSQSEPNSAQSTPARSVSKTLSVGAMGGFTRPPHSHSHSHCTGGRGVSSSSRVSVSRGISRAAFEPKVELPHFELEEDPSFWMDHNVQVLVRIRPMNTMEKVTHGYGRCLRQESSQTLVWLGHPETRFTFDHVACETVSQEKLFRVAGLPMVENCMSGYNSCMFAYGQTGGGKTYTMMGEIDEMEGKLNEDCGITPRIFEYLFTRISAEEENRGDEKLKYSCTCSFLEIYNEQITDLLEPSSTNLQLREDLKKGVYVENLTEYNVRTVTDVVKLLLEGAANRKMAATHMNSESSRSHSVFTCIIESRWEKDSMTHFRFARLNLVDLAGSERQKSSGAEGDRLKEAANINKSLSTLGLVIMSLVDLAHGKQRHVPYRDSRLTFLLQDSLGGNSKTMIVANVSPSISSVNETLSSLKFAQRAKLIQNNAKVNEDASGDVFALQRQIQQLKGQLSYLLKHHNLSRSLAPRPEECKLAEFSEELYATGEGPMADCHKTQNEQKKVESILLRSDGGDDMVSYNHADDGVQKTDNDQKMDENFAMQLHDTQEELRDARLLIEAMESEQLRLIEELRHLQEENHNYKEVFSHKTDVERQSVSNDESRWLELGAPRNQNNGAASESNEGITRIAFQAKLDRMSKDLEEVRLLNRQYQEDHTSNICHQHQVELVHEQVEMETTKTILHLQEEIAGLQLELQERVCSITQENTKLRETIAAKEDEIRAVRSEWEKATIELTNFLIDGSRSLKDASAQIEGIACSFPQVNVWISEQVERAAKVCIEKEETILLLQKSLEDAQNTVKEMELKLISLKLATMALEEVQQLENGESTTLPMLLDEKINRINVLEMKLKYNEDQVIEAEKRGSAAFMVVERLSDCQSVAVGHDAANTAFSLEDIEVQLELARQEILESKNAINSSYADAETYLTSHQTDIHRASSAYREFVHDLVIDIREMRKSLMNLKEDYTSFHFTVVDSSSLEPSESPMLENQYSILHKVRNELAETNGRLVVIKDCINTLIKLHVFPVMAEDTATVDEWSADCSTSGSECSVMGVASQSNMDMSSSTCCARWAGEISEGRVDLASTLPLSNQVTENQITLVKSSTPIERTILCLKKEMEVAFNSFTELYVWLATFFTDKETGACSSTKERRLVHPSCMLWIKEVETGCRDTWEFATDVNMEPPSSFLTKIEEAHAVIKEADFMLNVLLKANENAKQLTVMWRKTGEELMEQKASLMKEVEQLKSALCSKEKENELLCNQFHYALIEGKHSMSSLEESFLQMQRDVEEQFSVAYSNVLSMAQDMLCCIGNSRSSLEDVFSEMMEKGFASFVLYQCHLPFRRQECYSLGLSTKNDIIGNCIENAKEGKQHIAETYLEGGDLDLTHDSLIYENMSLKKELERKEILLKGLLFDFTLLQESASNTKDIKDETEKLFLALSQVRHELERKTCQLDDVLILQRKLERRMTEAEAAVSISSSELDQARETIGMLSDQNAELRMVLEDLYLNKSEVEEKLEEQKEAVKGLEKEILRLTSPVKKKFLSSVEDIEDDLSRVTSERDQLCEEVLCLTDKLEMAHALADENEAVAVEARQESEASKIYAEQKEEEVKILERSIEELECTINVLEKKVYEMDEELERHQMIRDSLELKLQALRQRMLTVESFTDSLDSENFYVDQSQEQLSRKLQNGLIELQEAHNHIRVVEEERAEQDREIKQLKEYISELVLHAEAQSSQYQQKYKTLEAMVSEVKADSLNSTSTAPTFDKTEKGSTRTRGSSSPFRCIAGLVQQMNVEKDQELSMARLRLEELEALASNRQKEVCMLNSRLAATESMTHDVIRDLLVVKLDLTNYANLIDQQQVQKLVEDAQQLTEESLAKEQEILNLRQQISNLMEERESCISELNRREEDILAAQMAVEQLQERDQLLAAQNEMLKLDKTNLKRKVAELDEMVKRLFGTPNIQQRTHKPTKTKEENIMLRLGNADMNKRLASSEKILNGVNEELAQYRKIGGWPGGSHQHDKTAGRGLERKYR